MQNAILVNYNYDPEWLKGKDWNVTIYDRSDDGIARDLTRYGRVIQTPNIGNVDYDKLGYLVEHYDELPETFIWGKTNLFKYVDEGTLDAALIRGTFAPLIRPDHKTYADRYGIVNFYKSGWYYERNNSWYLGEHPAHYQSWQEWATRFRLPSPPYIPFAPGGNYLLTRETVHQYSRDYYAEMRESMPYCQLPGEAQLAERSYGLMWGTPPL